MPAFSSRYFTSINICLNASFGVLGQVASGTIIMKATTFFTMLLAGVYSVTAASKPTQASEVANGFYQVTLDEAGDTTTKFTPWDEVGKSSPE
ncbi:hypothetical protein MJO29_002079 [Puccinia striiformis f. sp. tritici]|nr:hypothetical protein MJO29_002079 [Puccinia striiformis f. sp. tritici]